MTDELELDDYWFIIRSNILYILLIFVVVFAGVVYFTFTTSPVYQARTLVVINQEQSPLLRDVANVRFDIETQTEIIKSASVMQEYPDVEVEVNLIPKTNVIEITAESTDRYKTEQAANGIADSYVNYTINSRKNSASEVNVFITEQIDALKFEIDAMNALFEENASLYQGLASTIAAKEELYNYLLSRREEVSIVARENFGNVQVIERAEMPMFPVKPNIVLNLLVGLILGALAGLGFAFFKEYLRNTFRSLEEVEKRFGPIMGTLPKTKKTNLEYTHDASNEFAESIRKLRINLKFVMKDSGIRSIVMTSPNSGDGKTTVAENLAMALAQDRNRVLLVDANVRNPTIHKHYKKKSEPGLTDVIIGTISLEKAIHTDKHFHLLTAGTQNDWPSELFGSNTMKKLVSGLDYDIVIFDTPSLEYAETTLVSSDCQGTLLVVGFDRKNKDLAIKSKQALEKVKVDVVGVVVNFYK